MGQDRILTEGNSFPKCINHRLDYIEPKFLSLTIQMNVVIFTVEVGKKTHQSGIRHFPLLHLRFFNRTTARLFGLKSVGGTNIYRIVIRQPQIHRLSRTH